MRQEMQVKRSCRRGRNLFSPTRARGFSLSLGEGILVFIVAGLVIALGYKLFSSLMANYRANKVVNVIQIMIPRIQAAYANESTLKGLTSKVVAKSKWVPDSMITNDPDVPLETQWGRMVVQEAPGAPDEGNVILYDIPERECAAIVESLSGGVVRGVSVNSEEVKKATDSNVNLAKASEACAKGKATGSTIDFDFGR